MTCIIDIFNVNSQFLYFETSNARIRQPVIVNAGTHQTHQSI